MTEKLETAMPNEQSEAEVWQEESKIPAESDLPLDGPNHIEEVDVEAKEFGVAEDVERAEASEGESLDANDGMIEDAPCELQEGSDKKKRKKRRRRRKIDEYTLENDIKYRGPLSYRWLRIFAWLFLILSQIGLLLQLGGRLDAGLAEKTLLLSTALKMMSQIMMPLFLIATFATILNGSKSFKSMLILYGGAALLFYLLFILLHERYVAAIVSFVFEVDKAEAVAMIDSFLTASVSSGYMAFNIFVDLFLCTLLGFFLVYKPKKVFVGDKLVWFRSLAAIPIAYEVVSFILKMLGAFDVITVSPYLYALLTTKPPMTFVVFVVITVFIKVRERIYRKRGKTHEQYQEFLQTNANSWQFSKFLAIVMVVAGIVDFIIYFILTFAVLGNNAIATDEESITAILRVTDALIKCGIGGSGALVIAAPIMLLFSYTRAHKNTKMEMFIPIIAIIVLVFVYLEAIVIVANMVGSLSNLISKLRG